MPLTLASTTPPPTLAVNSCASTVSCALVMAACISAIFCCISAWRWAPVGLILPLLNPRRALYPIVVSPFIDRLFDLDVVELSAEFQEVLQILLGGGLGGLSHPEHQPHRHAGGLGGLLAQRTLDPVVV